MTSAIAAVLGLLAPDRLLPEPLADYRWIPTALVLVSFIVCWAWRDELTRRLRPLAAATVLGFLVLVALNILFVRAVRYQDPPETVHYLTGLTVSDPSRCGSVPEVIITQCGGEWGALTAAWGGSFTIVALGYIASYIMLTAGLTLAIGAAMTGPSGSRRPAG